MHTISFQVGDTAFERFLLLSQKTQQSTDSILNYAFSLCLEDLEEYLEAKSILESSEPIYTMEEAEELLGLAGKI